HFPPRQKSARETPATLRTRKCVAAGGRANRLLVLVPDFPPTMTTFASDDPRPRPDTPSPGRFLWWLLRGQGRLITSICLLTVVFLLPAALAPWAFGRAIDEGIIGGDTRAFATWVGLLAVTALLGAAVGGLHHYLSVKAWLIASYGTIDLVTNKTLQLGHVQGRRTPTGEAPSVAGADSTQYAAFAEVTGRAIGNVAAYLIVAVIVLNTNVHLGLIILLVAPVLALLTGPLLRPLQKAQTQERSRNSELTSMATDIVAGLRILRGIGGETTFAANYEKQSGRVREVGVRAGVWSGTIDAAGVLLSGIFVVGMMILGVREVKAGSLSVGALVTFVGYVLFLLEPIRTLFESPRNSFYRWSRPRRRSTFSAMTRPGRRRKQLPSTRPHPCVTSRVGPFSLRARRR